jgi:hypothetical protein
LATTGAQAPPPTLPRPLTSPAPHRSCTGGSPVWQLRVPKPHPPRSHALSPPPLPTGPAPVGARFGNYGCPSPAPHAPTPSHLPRSPPVLHRWEPGLATTGAQAPPPTLPRPLTSPAPHRSCTGGSPVWQLRVPKPRPPRSHALSPPPLPTGPAPVGARFGNYGCPSPAPHAPTPSHLPRSPPVLHRWEPGLATTGAQAPPSHLPPPTLPRPLTSHVSPLTSHLSPPGTPAPLAGR